jgi:organic radical activating enzyme
MKHFFRRVLGFDDLKEKIEILEEKNKKLEQQMREVDEATFAYLPKAGGGKWRVWGGACGSGSKLLKATSQGILKSINFHLTDHCNLNCIGCTHFSNLAEPSFLSLEEFGRDLSQIATLTHKVLEWIHLLGGEPLLHPQFLDFVKLSRKYFPDSKIRILTNGILLAKQNDDFWKVLHDNKALLFISDYPIDINIPLIKQKTKEYNVGVNIRVETMAEYRETQLDRQAHIVFDLKGHCDPQESFLNCMSWPDDCPMIRNGKLYLCPVCAYADIFNKYFDKNLLITSDDYIDIYEVKGVNEICEFLAGPKPFCRYCNTRKTIMGLKWQPSKKEISEWT